MAVLGEGTFPLWQIVVNLTMFQTFVNVPNLWVFYWTLSIELIFYIGCIGLFAIGLLNQRLTAFYIVVAAALIWIFRPLIVNYWIVLRLVGCALKLTAIFPRNGFPGPRICCPVPV